VFDFFSYNQ